MPQEPAFTIEQEVVTTAKGEDFRALLRIGPHALEVTLCAAVLCLRFEGSVTSWIRTPRHNKDVGGDPRSRHLTGEAVDVRYDGEPPSFADVLEVATQYHCRVRREFGENAHDHIEPRGDGHA